MGFKFLMTGKDSAKLAKKEEAEAQQRREEQGKMWRFWMADGGEARITFVDGELCDEGHLLPPRFYEHTVDMPGQKMKANIVCPEKTDPASGQKCPLCAQGDRAALVSLFTIIDHRPYKSRTGEVVKDSRKILAAKPTTFELLNKLATKRGGLVGCTFDVSRSGDKSAAVGSLFDFVEKGVPAELYKKYMKEVKDPKTGKVTKVSSFTPANYEEEIVYRDEEALTKMFGFSPTAGSSPMPSASKPQGKAVSDAELEDHL